MGVNLAQQLAGLSNEPLLQVLMGVHKAYNSLDGELFLELLRG